MAMGIIRNYLDNMFLGLPQTEEVIRAKNELLAMMEDKYNELKNEGKTENEAIGIVISEFGNLEELAEALGIKEVLEKKTDIPILSYDEAKQYIEDSIAIAPKTALGVFLCIIAPATLLFILGLRDMNIISVKEEVTIALGLTALILLVAAGVSQFIRFSSQLEKYDYLESNVFQLDYVTEQMVRNTQAQDENSYKYAVSISVMCYILSALPVIIVSLILENGGLILMAVTTTLVIVALATYNLIVKSSVNEACNVLLQLGDYSAKIKSNKTYQTILRAYWCIITALYLGYSFITFNWAMSWIIWPVAGVLFGAVKAIAGRDSNSGMNLR